MATASTVVNLDALVTICQSLESLVASSLGPGCLKTLLCTATGSLRVTNSGVDILNALHMSHPIAKLIVDSIKTCHNFTGDGSKTYMLYLTYLLLGVRKCVGRNAETIQEREKMIQISFGINKFLQVLPTLHPLICPASLQPLEDQRSTSLQPMGDQISTCAQPMRDQRSTCMQPIGDQKRTCMRLCAGQLSTCYSRRMVDHFSNLMTNFVGSNIGCGLAMNYLIDDFDLMHVKCNNDSYSSSTCVPGIVLERRFQLKCSPLDDTVLAIFLRCPVEHVSQELGNDVTISIRTESNIQNNLQEMKTKTTKFLKKCCKLGVKLIIMTEKMPNFVLSQCQSVDISVICYILEEDMVHMEYAFTVQSVSSTNDEITRNNVCIINSKQLFFGGRTFVHLYFAEKHIAHNIPDVKMLLLYAPTEGLCKQLSINLHRTLKVLQLAFHDYRNENVKQLIGGSTAADSQPLQLGGSTAADPQPLPQGGSTAADPQPLQIGGSTAADPQPLPQGGSTAADPQPLQLGGSTAADPQPLQQGLDFDKDPDVMQAEFINDLTSHDDLINPVKGRPLQLIPTGAGFEFAFSKHLTDFKKTCSDQNLIMFCDILHETMLNFTQILHRNLSPATTNKKQYLIRKECILQNLNGGVSAWFDRRGECCSAADDCPLEPLAMKWHILESVLRILRQLLRIDSIVSVRSKDNETEMAALWN